MGGLIREAEHIHIRPRISSCLHSCICIPLKYAYTLTYAYTHTLTLNLTLHPETYTLVYAYTLVAQAGGGLGSGSLQLNPALLQQVRNGQGALFYRSFFPLQLRGEQSGCLWLCSFPFFSSCVVSRAAAYGCTGRDCRQSGRIKMNDNK